MDFKDKTVVVTGASRGIGKATAQAVAKKGGRLVLLARTERDLRAVADGITREGGRAAWHSVDLTDAPAVEQCAAVITRETGVPDIIINNAGLGRWLYAKDTTPEEARQMVASPYLAAFYVTRAFLPAMLERGSGHIACVTSPGSFLVWPGAATYLAARFALRGFSEALRAEVQDHGIGVTLVVLGKAASTYWEYNPGSEAHLPKPLPVLMPTLSTEQAAEVILRGIERNAQQIVRPAIFRVFFAMNHFAPGIVLKALAR